LEDRLKLFRAVVAGYFPAYLPVLVLALKWSILQVGGLYNFANIVPDFTLAILSFYIWAVTAALRQQMIRIDGQRIDGENIIIWVFFFVHLVIYAISVSVWLRPSTNSKSISILLMVYKLLTLFVAVAICAGPFFVLGLPSKQNDA